jgi:hypothetical protein
MSSCNLWRVHAKDHVQRSRINGVNDTNQGCKMVCEKWKNESCLRKVESYDNHGRYHINLVECFELTCVNPI